MFRNQNNGILSFMNCICNSPSRTSITISHPNFVAGFSNFEPEVNDNYNNNNNTRNNNNNNSVRSPTNPNLNHNETVTNNHSLTVASSSPNITSSNRATGWDSTGWNLTNKSHENSTNIPKSWSNKVTVAKTAYSKETKSSWGSFSQTKQSSWGKYYSKSGTSNESEQSANQKYTSKTTSILKSSSITIINHDWYTFCRLLLMKVCGMTE